MTFQIDDDALYPPEETAKILGLSKSWLAQLRCDTDATAHIQGPKYVIVGQKSVRYPGRYLREYIYSNIKD